MKYVILIAKTKDGDEYAFQFAFSSRLVHAQFARRAIHLVKFDSPFVSVEVLSAGTLYMLGDNEQGADFRCQPGSETLNIKAEGSESDNGERDADIFNLIESCAGNMVGLSIAKLAMLRREREKKRS